jgi:hypothetical protein
MLVAHRQCFHRLRELLVKARSKVDLLVLLFLSSKMTIHRTSLLATCLPLKWYTRKDERTGLNVAPPVHSLIAARFFLLIGRVKQVFIYTTQDPTHFLYYVRHGMLSGMSNTCFLAYKRLSQELGRFICRILVRYANTEIIGYENCRHTIKNSQTDSLLLHFVFFQGDNESQRDLILATRRVESAICAFGGTLRSRDSTPMVNQNDETKYSDFVYQQTDRFAVNQSKLSWDVEENETRSDTEIMKGDNPTSGSRADSSSQSEGTLNDPAKVKYRCKLCGQWKQNHQCRYQQALQRSIGVMVYPAVNSYTAAEPGIIAPPLTKMNNFVSYDSDPGDDSPHSDHATLRRPKVNDGDPFAVHTSTVTPESLRGATHFHSPQSSLSAQSSDDPLSRQVGVANAGINARSRRYLKRSHNELTMDATSSAHHGGYDAMRGVLPFVASVTLRPEHYRAVTPLTKDPLIVTPDPRSSVGPTADSVEHATRNTSATRALYEYPPIPLTYQERKRLSDTLFYLAQEIPSLTCDCAALLRVARSQGEWDTAVAELLAQVVVALYCGEGDLRLDGLQQYLLTIGISC